MKEVELAQKEILLDSSSKNPTDSIIALHPQLPGKLGVTMRCTETNCSGSNIGETKYEQFEIGYRNGGMVAQVFNGIHLVCV